MDTVQQELIDNMAARRCHRQDSTDNELAGLIKPFCVFALMVAGGLGFATLFSGGRANATIEPPPQATYTPPDLPKLTVDRYYALQPGMTFTDVALTLGVGVDYKEVQTAGELVTYQCRDGERFVIVTLDGGRLVSKAQSGL